MTSPAAPPHALLSITDSLTADGAFVFARSTAVCVCGFSIWVEGSRNAPESVRHEARTDIATRHIFLLNTACRTAGERGAAPTVVEDYAPLAPARFREFYIDDALYDAVLAFARDRRLYASEAAAELVRVGLRCH